MTASEASTTVWSESIVMDEQCVLRCPTSDIAVSVVVPIHNECGNIEPLLNALDAAMPLTGRSYEYVLVDDGSTDGSAALLDGLAERRDDLVVIHLRRCFGQTAALDAGIRNSRGEMLAFLDADLQNDPADIPLLLERLEQGYDVVHGWRKIRQDVFWSRRLPSLAANWLIRRLTGVKVKDLGCAIRVIRRDLAEELPLEGDMHRFIAVLADARGGRWSEIPVRHHPRRSGRSKYGLSRTFKVAVDLAVLCWFTRLAVPMTRLLIGAGLLLLVTAPLCVVVATMSALAGSSVSWWQVMTTATLTGFAGFSLVGVGIIAATTVSTWWRSRNLHPWSIRPLGRVSETHCRQVA
ncbi:MAG: glycosyltransferase family 2 protein [Planctomycetota bacterium]|nr:glycosyltransferase family 2 protein [Planctomycetota bacterium]